MDGDILELSTIDLTDPNTPSFANIKTQGNSPALKINFKKTITNNKLKGNACGYFNPQTLKYEFSNPNNAQKPGEPM